MHSLIPFQDLNLIPTASSSASSSYGDSSSHIAPTQSPLTVPKLEPNDESLPQTHLQLHFPQGPSPNLTLHYPPQVSPPALGQIPENTSSTDERVVYSDVHRLSEFFRPAVAEEVQYNGDVGGVNAESGTIVPVPVPEVNRLPIAFPQQRLRGRGVERRSSELVRFNALGIEEERYYRGVVKKTRMVYSSLRILACKDADNRKRNRSDLKAGTFMMNSGLGLNRDKIIVGSIPGVMVGDMFFRMELCVVGLHGQTQTGINYLPTSIISSGEPVTTSIIVSGGYEDDEDYGEVLIYTGLGGRDRGQSGTQEIRDENLGLETSKKYEIDIRVIRGYESSESPNGKIYIYDGLYRIVDAWRDKSKSSGSLVIKYKLLRLIDQPEMGTAIMKISQYYRNGPLYARPFGYLGLDISGGKEKVPVLIYNNIDGDIGPTFYPYITSSIFPRTASFAAGCDCVRGCNDNCVCAMRNGGDFAYDNQGHLVRGKPVVVECGPGCRCPPSCRNRLSQKGLRYMFEVFRSNETGWGVRSLDLIQAGSFICEYAGIVLTKEQAQTFSMNGGGNNLIHPNRFGKRWMEWGNLSGIIPDYVHPEHPSTPSLDFALDVSRSRNLACYISRNPNPNIMVQFVLRGQNNLLIPSLMLFALETIPPLQQPTLDYDLAQTNS
ncbi:histone-lysine N-methyltransferase family member SUVH9-like [Impatiens glandulifera]|uniref:histone-lysine N-methyltransferase family member SUVH9-like n=1 Tax=Impatiens glandulifera TaxID=253017 RepID=UPI001FB0A676|nr:histone-lysine N-methyltransferase family member SUVH9-like [Impatiens glandulifera]